MSIYQSIYLTLLASAFLTSLVTHKFNKSLKVLSVLLGFSLATEIIVSVLYYVVNKDYNFVYHIYVPLEYTLLGYFFFLNTEKEIVKKIIIASMLFHFVASCILSLFFVPITSHPGLSLNISGILLSGLTIYTLFNLEPVPGITIMRHPIFWITIGILFFHMAILFYNGFLSSLNSINEDLGIWLQRFIMKPANYLMYLFFIIGYLCSNRLRKYS